MRMFLLTQMEQFTKRAIENATTVFYKSSTYTSSLIAITAAVVMSPVYAGQQLSDAELGSKYIEVQIRQICTIDNADSKKADDKKGDFKAPTYTCSPDNLFVTTVKRDGNLDAKQIDSSSDQSKDSADSVNSSALLAGILQNLRSSGRADLLGLPAGVANTGSPLLFGSERYSYAWAGNLNQIFQAPYYESGYWNSIYDTSSLGYGFRAEAHFPYGPPAQPTIQAITSGGHSAKLF